MQVLLPRGPTPCPRSVASRSPTLLAHGPWRHRVTPLGNCRVEDFTPRKPTDHLRPSRTYVVAAVEMPARRRPLMNLQEFSARHFRPNRPHGMDLQESSVLFGLGGTLGRSSTTQRPSLGHGVVGGGLGGTPLAARPPAPGLRPTLLWRSRCPRSDVCCDEPSGVLHASFPAQPFSWDGPSGVLRAFRLGNGLAVYRRQNVMPQVRGP